MSRPSKDRVRSAFAKAAAAYDQAAHVQRQACAHLAALLPPTLPAPGRLLDAGCGTGYGLIGLAERYPGAQCLALDLAPAMLARVAPPALRLAGDVERLPLAPASLDLYWSSLVWQWCDPAAALGEARRVLRPGGQLRVASLGPATFHELRQVFAGIDPYRHTLSFADGDTLADAARQAGFAASWQGTSLVAHYPDLRSLLRAVKTVGANQVGEGRRTGLMGRQTWAKLEAAYEALRTPAGLPLSYDLILLQGEAR